jgi:dihydropteroate synthase
VALACAEADAELVITHTRLPPKQKGFPAYADVMEDVIALRRERVAEAAGHGVGEERIVLDPGLDLAKTPAQSVELLRRLPELCALGRPVLVAASRKDFVGALTGRAPADRDAGTLAALGAAVEGGASILRVHDVAGARDFLEVRAALRGEREVPELDESLRREPDAGRSSCAPAGRFA